MRLLLTLFLNLILLIPAVSQNSSVAGIIAGNVLDEKTRAVEGATIELLPFSDSINLRKTILTNKNGEFGFTSLGFGWYRLKVTYIGYAPMILDSIHVREERADFNLNDLTLRQSDGEQLDAVVVYAEKPLIQSKDGNITFNASESPLSAGSSAAELLKSVPLVAADPDGNLSVRGKEPKILIDDKPVQLSAQQLQDLLESLPGSMIERIEVMTNPPPQYANEQGGVINIVTRKGRVGIGGRISVSAGSRGEAGANMNFNYRKKGLAINLNMGSWFNRFTGNGYSTRENIYTDSTNYLYTNRSNKNKSSRPNARLNIDYDLNKYNSINFTFQFDQNIFDNSK